MSIVFTLPLWITICYHSCLASKLSARAINFLQACVLNAMGPIAMLFEHVYRFHAETKPRENVILRYEQMKDLGAITSNAIRLLGNASAL